MDPKKWGATTWWFEHWLANKVDTTINSMRAQGFVGESDTKIQTELLKLFVDFVGPFNEQLLPCQSCQKSTRVFLRILPPKQILKTFHIQHTSTASDLLFRLHNVVNQKLRKRPFSAAEFNDFITSNEFQTFPLQNLEFVEAAILHCLNKWPNKRKTFVSVFSKYLAPLLWHLHTYAAFGNMTSAQKKTLLTLAQRFATIT